MKRIELESLDRLAWFAFAVLAWACSVAVIVLIVFAQAGIAPALITAVATSFIFVAIVLALNNAASFRR